MNVATVTSWFSKEIKVLKASVELLNSWHLPFLATSKSDEQAVDLAEKQQRPVNQKVGPP